MRSTQILVGERANSILDPDRVSVKQSALPVIGIDGLPANSTGNGTPDTQPDGLNILELGLATPPAPLESPAFAPAEEIRSVDVPGALGPAAEADLAFHEDMVAEDVDMKPPVATSLADSIPGLYRILDLVTEHGSGGLGQCSYSPI